MGRWIVILWLILAAVVVVLGYIRLAPSNPAQWHVTPEFTVNRNMKGGAVRIVENAPDGLARLDRIARATPRTEVLAGSVESGMVTYITRTRMIGFPDYTTAWQDGDRLVVHARLRFGRSDFGVNRARIEGWLAALEP